MAVVTVVSLSPDVGLYVFALVVGMYAAAVRIRDGATGIFLTLFCLAIFAIIMAEIIPT